MTKFCFRLSSSIRIWSECFSFSCERSSCIWNQLSQLGMRSVSFRVDQMNFFPALFWWFWLPFVAICRLQLFWSGRHSAAARSDSDASLSLFPCNRGRKPGDFLLSHRKSQWVKGENGNKKQCETLCDAGDTQTLAVWRFWWVTLRSVPRSWADPQEDEFRGNGPICTVLFSSLHCPGEPFPSIPSSLGFSLRKVVKKRKPHHLAIDSKSLSCQCELLWHLWGNLSTNNWTHTGNSRLAFAFRFLEVFAAPFGCRNHAAFVWRLQVLFWSCSVHLEVCWNTATQKNWLQDLHIRILCVTTDTLGTQLDKPITKESHFVSRLFTAYLATVCSALDDLFCSCIFIWRSSADFPWLSFLNCSASILAERQMDLVTSSSDCSAGKVKLPLTCFMRDNTISHQMLQVLLVENRTLCGPSSLWFNILSKRENTHNLLLIVAHGSVCSGCQIPPQHLLVVLYQTGQQTILLEVVFHSPRGQTSASPRGKQSVACVKHLEKRCF